MTANQQAVLKRLQSKWAEGTATLSHIMRCMELEQLARASIRS